MKYTSVLLASLTIAASACALAKNDSRLYEDSHEAIAKRIRPIGQVNVKLTADDKAKLDAQQVAAKPKPMSKGEETYKTYCVTCHSMGVAGAPKFHNQADWAPRMKVGIDALVSSAIKGKNAMPPKGTCADCTREDIHAAIEYMLPKKSTDG